MLCNITLSFRSSLLSVTFPIGRLAELHMSYEEYKDRQESSWDVKFKIRPKN